MALTRAELARRVQGELRAGQRVWLSPELPDEFVAGWPPPPPEPAAEGADVVVVGAHTLSHRGELAAPHERVPRGARVFAVVELERGGTIARATLPARALRASRVFTELGVLEVRPGGLVLVELAPGVSARELQERVEPTLKVSPRVREMVLAGDRLDGDRSER